MTSLYVCYVKVQGEERGCLEIESEANPKHPICKHLYFEILSFQKRKKSICVLSYTPIILLYYSNPNWQDRHLTVSFLYVYFVP